MPGLFEIREFMLQPRVEYRFCTLSAQKVKPKHEALYVGQYSQHGERNDLASRRILEHSAYAFNKEPVRKEGASMN